MRTLLLLLLLFAASPSKAGATALSYIVTDMDGVVLIEKNADDVRSIASITKLLIAREAATQDQDELIEIIDDDTRWHGQRIMRSSPLKVGKQYTRRNLIELALITSDNTASRAIGRNLPTLPQPMVEASGIDPANQLTARQLAAISRELYNTDVAAISVQPVAKLGSVERRSSNPLLERAGWNFYLSKTGYIKASGGCLVVIVEIVGRPLVVALLGSGGVRERWKDLAELRRELGDSQFAEPIYAVAKKPRRTTKRRHI